jgi:hypothetical protein
MVDKNIIARHIQILKYSKHIPLRTYDSITCNKANGKLEPAFAFFFPLALQPNSGLSHLHETSRFTSVTIYEGWNFNNGNTVVETPCNGTK